MSSSLMTAKTELMLGCEVLKRAAEIASMAAQATADGANPVGVFKSVGGLVPGLPGMPTLF